MKSKFFIVMREVVGDSSHQFDISLEDFAKLFRVGRTETELTGAWGARMIRTDLTGEIEPTPTSGTGEKT